MMLRYSDGYEGESTFGTIPTKQKAKSTYIEYDFFDRQIPGTHVDLKLFVY